VPVRSDRQSSSVRQRRDHRLTHTPGSGRAVDLGRIRLQQSFLTAVLNLIGLTTAGDREYPPNPPRVDLSASHAESRWFEPSRDHHVKRSSFRKERGRSRPRLVVFSLVCELPDPGWRVEIGIGVKARAEPDRGNGRRALTATPFGARSSGQGESKRLVLLSGLRNRGSVSSSRPVSRRGAGEGAAGQRTVWKQ
jgi:hypothetical protein